MRCFIFFSAAECVSAWNGLRCGYAKAQQRASNRPSGSAGGSAPKWSYFEAMSFIKPTKDGRATATNLLSSAVEAAGINTSATEEEEEVVGILEEVEREPALTRPIKKKREEGPIEQLAQKLLNKTESPQMDFFRGIVGQVDKLDDDGLLYFQGAVIRELGIARQQTSERAVAAYNSGTNSRSRVESVRSRSASSASHGSPFNYTSPSLLSPDPQHLGVAGYNSQQLESTSSAPHDFSYTHY